MLDLCKIVEKQSKSLHTFLWHFIQVENRILFAYRSSKVSSHPDGIFEIYQALVGCISIPAVSVHFNLKS